MENCYKHIQSIEINFKNMGMYIDERYDTEVCQNRCHSPRHRTTFLTRRPLLSTLIASQAAFFLRLLSRVCLQSSAAGGLIARRFPFFREDTRAST